MFYPRVVRVEYRIEPCRSALTPGEGHAVQVVAQPVHGLRPPLHVLLRPPLRAARRPALGRPLRPLDPREAERRRGAPARARARVMAARGGRAGHRDRPVPAGRGALPAHACVHRRARRLGDAVLDRHPRAARRPRRRRARRGGAGGSAWPSTSPSPRSTSRSGGRPSPAPRRRRAGFVRSARWRTQASTSASGWRRSSRGSRTGPSSSRPSSARRGRRARGRSGRRSSTCDPACASTSSRRSHATGPSRSSGTRRSSASVRISPPRLRMRSPLRRTLRGRRRGRCAEQRPVRREPKQLALSI